MTSSPTRSRKSLAVLALGAMVLALAALGMQAWPAAAAERPETPERALEGTAGAPRDSGPAATPEAPPLDLATRPEASAPQESSQASTGFGTIRGMVLVAPALRNKITQLTLVLSEAVNEDDGRVEPPANTARRFVTVPVPADSQDVYFEVPDVPFSDYGWRIAPRTPNLNGSEAFAVLRPESPDANVKLRVTPGIPASITIRDQHRVPVGGIPVELKPIGRPLGRAAKTGETDAYGLLILENVLAGNYEVRLGNKTEPLLARKEIRIADRGHHYETFELPRGGRFEARLIGAIGLGIEGVKVELIAVDSKIYRKYEGESDKQGDAVLPHVPPGRYYAHFTKKGYERLFRQVTVQTSGNTPLRCTMKRSR